ncbi:MAG: tyrosine-type recombinase/integrase [Pseudonocardiales bacterium]
MTAIAPTLQSFFTDRLARHRQASPHTIAAYRDTLRLLLQFLQQRTGIAPARLDWADLDADTICAFLDHLEADRRNSARTRNARLTAIRSLFAYAALRHPEHAGLIARVLAIPTKRFDKATVTFLDDDEVSALLRAPDRHRWEGRRDYTLILVAIQTGLRVSELLGLNCDDVIVGVGAHLRCKGKGRKHRAVPITGPVENAIQAWLAERHARPDEPVFTTRTGRRLSPDAVQRRVNLHAATAAAHCPSLHGRKLSPHVFRHTSAMSLLHAGVDTTVIALWLGHADVRSTNTYLHADLAIKERALARVAPINTKTGRYRPPDKLLAFLEAL